MNKRNYQKELDRLIENITKEGKVPRLFLHSCCAPCSSYVLEYLSQYFEITVFFYNPNISLEEEYRKRVAEIRRLVAEMSFTHPVHIEEGTYDPQVFYEMAKGMEKVPEGGERCFKCYRLRMEEAAKLAEIYKVPHLPSDFKKKNGYKRSIELSHEFDLYRQNYCGCVFSKREQEEKLKQKLK